MLMLKIGDRVRIKSPPSEDYEIAVAGSEGFVKNIISPDIVTVVFYKLGTKTVPADKNSLTVCACDLEFVSVDKEPAKAESCCDKYRGLFRNCQRCGKTLVGDK